MTDKPIRELPILVGGQEPLYRERLGDEAFAAFKRGDENRLAGLLKASGDLRGETESPVALLLEAAERKSEKLNLPALIREADPNGQEDPRIVAMVLCATGGNVDLTDKILAAMDDDGDDSDPDGLPSGSGILLQASRAVKSNKSHLFNLSADPNTNADGTANTHGLSTFLHRCENFFSNLLHLHKSQLEDTTDGPAGTDAKGGTDANAPATISDQQMVSTTKRIFGQVFGGIGSLLGGPTPPGPKSGSGS